MTREARTEPFSAPSEAAATTYAASDAIEGTVDTAPENSVTLSDGRVAVLAENSAFAARQARKALSRMGMDPAIDSMDYTVGMAIMSLVSIDGQPFKKPINDVMMNAILMEMMERDTYALSLAYGRLVGQGNPSDGDFR